MCSTDSFFKKRISKEPLICSGHTPINTLLIEMFIAGCKKFDNITFC